MRLSNSWHCVAVMWLTVPIARPRVDGRGDLTSYNTVIFLCALLTGGKKVIKYSTALFIYMSKDDTGLEGLLKASTLYV